MATTAGIIGLPNVGKSTIFNALTNGKAAVENYPFCTIEPNMGIVVVPDSRLHRISALLPAVKVVPAFLELVDIAGLVKGASGGEGLGNQFLGHIKNVNAILHVVRCFEDPDVAHLHGGIDPLRDIEIVNTELQLKDLETIENVLAVQNKAAKVGDKEARVLIPLLERVQEAVGRGLSVRSVLKDQAELSLVSGLNLLTAKRVLYIANVDEAGIIEDSGPTRTLSEFAKRERAEFMKLCGKLEAEIVELPESDRDLFLHSAGLEEPGLHLLARKIYSLLGFITFFSVSEKENRAWTIPLGTEASRAAGTIHSDFEKGFIKAEVYSLADLEEYKTEAELRSHGKIRQEGKSYIVRDGDIIYFRFNL